MSSPRTLQACKEEGILPEEMLKTANKVQTGMRKNKAIVEMRIKFFEEKRKELIHIVTQARKRIIEAEEA